MWSHALIYLFIYCRWNQGISSFIYSKRGSGPIVLRIFIKILATATLWVVIYPFIRQPVTLWVVIYLFIWMLIRGSRLFIYLSTVLVPANCLFIYLFPTAFLTLIFFIFFIFFIFLGPSRVLIYLFISGWPFWRSSFSSFSILNFPGPRKVLIYLF